MTVWFLMSYSLCNEILRFSLWHWSISSYVPSPTELDMFLRGCFVTMYIDEKITNHNIGNLRYALKSRLSGRHFVSYSV